MGQNAVVPAETVQRRWTVATWLLAGVDDFETVAHALEPLSADAIALQSVHERDADTVAAALGMQMAWEVSHYPRSRVFIGSSVGLAVLTPHRVSASHATVTSAKSSLWSTSRRIAQFCTVERHDHTAYTLVHAVGPTHGAMADAGGFPLVRMVPEQVGVDETRAIELPPEASAATSTVAEPIEGANGLQATSFELPWVKGDFPVI
ncbi:hypothetical protein BDK89_1407 [Ilumatobacter fluminis]|uniref:Uncharacterized protein n=1 Tax=Ilumatobacter fluminis TaxID=467091 RepID=A0A4V3EIV2_9ACTN|nr:hypothetical protein BDK89_1407 [Ilumatobacter fluminis]